MDVRGCYCALAVCHMLNLDKAALAEACGMVEYIKACQVGGRVGGRVGGWAGEVVRLPPERCSFAGEAGLVDNAQ